MYIWYEITVLCVCVCLSVCPSVCLYVFVCLFLYVCMHMCMYVFMCTCTRIHLELFSVVCKKYCWPQSVTAHTEGTVHSACGQ